MFQDESYQATRLGSACGCRWNEFMPCRLRSMGPQIQHNDKELWQHKRQAYEGDSLPYCNMKTSPTKTSGSWWIRVEIDIRNQGRCMEKAHKKPATSINTSRMPGQCQTPSLQCLKVSVVTQGWAKHWQECLATRTIRILRNQTNHRKPHILKGCWGASCIFPYLLIENCKQGSPTRIWAPALSAVIHPVVLQALDPKWSTSKDQPSGFEELGIASLITRQDRQGHPVFFNLPPCFFNPPPCLFNPLFF